MKLKVWLISNNSKIGGGGRFQITLAKKLKISGWNPSILIHKKGDFSNTVQKEGLSVKIGWFNLPFKTSYILTLFNSIWLIWKIYREKPILIHANSTAVARPFLIGARLFRIPVICHVHLATSKQQADWEFKYLPLPKKIIFVSYSTLNECKTFYPSVEKKVIHNGVPLSSPRAEKKFASDGIAIGMAANFQAIKGHEDFVEMAKILKDKEVHAKYHLFGGEDHFNSGRIDTIKQLVSKNNLEEDFYFHGFVNDIYSKLAMLDIYVCSSHLEAFPLSLLEAMSIPLPIVTTDVNGIPEMINDGVEGYLVPAHQPQKLADKVYQLVSNSDLRDSVASNARARLEREFTQELMVENILKEFEKTIGDLRCAKKSDPEISSRQQNNL